MSLVILGEELREACREVAEYSSKKENWYIPQKGNVPGDNPKHCVFSGTIKAVFSWTLSTDGVIRQMSVSTHGREQGRYPQPIIVWTLAHYFGFTGAVQDEHDLVREPNETSWGVAVNHDEKTIVVAQEVEPEALTASEVPS